jgi:hypothetical protein
VKKLIILISLFVIACSKPQTNSDKAILAIQQYVKNNLPNVDYKSIAYSKLDSGYEYPDTLDIQIENLREAILIEHQADSVKQAVEAQLNQMGVAMPKPDTGSKFKNQITIYQNKLNNLLASPKQKHYYISNKYSLKNQQGNLEINTINYEIDTTFKIIDTN